MTTTHEPLDPIRDALRNGEHDLDRLHDAVDGLAGISLAASDADRSQLARFADVLGRLLQVVLSLADSEETQQEAWQVRDFVGNAIDCLDKALTDDPDAQPWMDELCRDADDRWGDCLDLIAPSSDVMSGDESWEDRNAESPELDAPVDGQQIGIILGSLAEDASANDPPSDSATSSEDTPPDAGDADDSGDDVDESSRLQNDAPDESLLLDPDIREAYVDDAQRCLASIEASLLAYEENPSQAQPLKQVCRELHTLKGASASVGLGTLASFLHQVEDDLESATEKEGPVDLQSIFKAVDAVRKQMSDAQGSNSTRPTAYHEPAAESFVGGGRAQDSVRVKSAQLDRLMDMLAELVMLRNRRQSRVEQLKGVHNELIHCVSRLRAYEENYSATSRPFQVASTTGESATHPVVSRHNVSSLTEIANDLLELGGSLRELYEPVGDENRAISRFIRQFRQELIQLRRVPVAGLFQRLQRATRDAARVEGRQVRLETLGEDVGLESSVQQQLYEPLLHIVRNAVSHGIEPESHRVAHGKAPMGTVTLKAHGGANLLVLTVRDDGRGLDYDALRQRGIQMGLIASDRHASRAELARLIFHPGFSTRGNTNEISGRGVGMDVVATALERMHSWIEVDSTPGQGTSVRLLIPLRSVIEHVMVFRVGGQDFGIPTQNIRFAGSPSSTDTSDFPIAHLCTIAEHLESRPSTHPQLFVLAGGWNSDKKEMDGSESAEDTPEREQRLGVLVDEIVGPEEVVVRPLPNLMGKQSVFTGVTLSGTGDIMLLFDSKWLLERGLAIGNCPGAFTDIEGGGNDEDSRKSALVIDDSRSSRRTLAHLLHRHGYRTEEAADGAEALRQLKDKSYDVVFTDLEMPQLNGLDLLREIRSDSRITDMPVVMVSSRGEETFRKRARDLRVNDYLTKPVSDAVITQALDRLEELLERTDA